MLYKSKRVTAYGMNFKSMLEFEIYSILINLKERGENVSSVNYEKERFKIVDETTETLPTGKKKRHGACFYTPDFSFDYNGKKIIIEAKGYATDIYRLRKKIFLSKYPILAPTFFEIKNISELELMFYFLKTKSV